VTKSKDLTTYICYTVKAAFYDGNSVMPTKRSRNIPLFLEN